MLTCPVRAAPNTLGRRRGEVLLAYGQAADGRILHISEVPSGLACGCACPECDSKLVAHKGEDLAHHFAHYAVTNCSGGTESALHKLAKQVIAEHGVVATPAVKAQHADQERLVRRQALFRPDSVVLEKRMDGMRPDLIARRGDHELLVEVAVTHACGAKKIALIRERQLAAIEIDLGRVAHDAPKDEVVDAILYSAPRTWLFNRYGDEATAELRAAAERRDAEERARQERDRQRREAKRNADVQRLASAYPQAGGRPASTQATAPYIARICDAGLERFVGVPVNGGACFAVGDAAWQSVVVSAFLLTENIRVQLGFQTKEVLKVLRDAGLVRREFTGFLSEDLAQAVREQLPGFRSPYEAIESYLETLKTSNLLHHIRWRWSIADYQHTLEHARKRLKELAAERGRVASLRKTLVALLAELPEGHGVDPDRWMRTRHPGLDRSPAEMAALGDWGHTEMWRHLTRLRRMRDPGASVEENLLGLPFEQERELRREERRLADGEKARKAEAAARQAGAQRLQELSERAVTLLGPEEARRWLNTPLRLLDDAAAISLEMMTADQLNVAYKALRIELARLVAEGERQARAEQHRERLRREAERVLGAKADLWMRSTNPQLRNRRPIEACVDESSLAECFALLKPQGARGRRG